MLKCATLAISLLTLTSFAPAISLSDCKLKNNITASDFLNAKNDISFFISGEKTFTQRNPDVPCIFASQDSSTFLVITKDHSNFQYIRIEDMNYGPINYDANGNILNDKYNKLAEAEHKILANKIIKDFQSAIKN